MKYDILDLEVELESGEIVNIEMQLKDNKNIKDLELLQNKLIKKII